MERDLRTARTLSHIEHANTYGKTLRPDNVILVVEDNANDVELTLRALQ